MALKLRNINSTIKKGMPLYSADLFDGFILIARFAQVSLEQYPVWQVFDQPLFDRFIHHAANSKLPSRQFDNTRFSSPENLLMLNMIGQVVDKQKFLDLVSAEKTVYIHSDIKPYTYMVDDRPYSEEYVQALVWADCKNLVFANVDMDEFLERLYPTDYVVMRFDKNSEIARMGGIIHTHVGNMLEDIARSVAKELPDISRITADAMIQTYVKQAFDDLAPSFWSYFQVIIKGKKEDE